MEFDLDGRRTGARARCVQRRTGARHGPWTRLRAGTRGGHYAVRSLEAIEQVVKRAVFLNDDDDVLDLPTAGLLSRERWKVARHARRRNARTPNGYTNRHETQ